MASYYSLDEKDLDTIQQLVQANINVARADESIPDDEMAHLYTLKGKLAKIRESREREPEPRGKKGNGPRQRLSKRERAARGLDLPAEQPETTEAAE